MDPIKNPFSPGAGSPPPALVGRQAILKQAKITLERIKSGRPEKSALLIGLRGVGKTVLLRTIEEEATKIGFQTLFIEAPEYKPLSELLVPPLREILFRLDRMEGLSEKVKRALRVLRSFIGPIKIANENFSVTFDVEPEKGTADSGDLQADLTSLLNAIAEAAGDRRTAVALFIDELQYITEEEFGALIMAIHAVGQKSLPLVLFGAGLPQLMGLAGKAKSYAERLFSYPNIGPLNEKDAGEALISPAKEQGVIFDSGAIEKIVRVTGGYPYFIQEWGYEVWNAASQSPINLDNVEESTQLVIKKLDENFFRVRFDRLTPSEKSYLRAMAELGQGPFYRSGDITGMLGIKVQSGAPIRSSLIKKGMIYGPSHGDTAFTVPLFGEFMRRTMPTPQKKQ
ncbi:MAG TPA: AAA family ATPase [Deltaproteobacteria bacterium]|nr:AAA family ATPase [Deltaproteobacteria bacterium]